jgi:hypothetical protein
VKARHLWLVAVLIVLVACAQGNPPGPAGVDLEGLLPEASSLESWRIVEGPSSYTPDTLWEYLDGGAPRYEAYGFERMIHSRYQLGNDSLASVTADVYDMGSELGAFGIYSSIRSPDATFHSWGAEGYSFGTVAAAWKGQVFAHVAADDERPELIEMMQLLAAHVCDEVTGSVSLPTVLQRLPQEDLVLHSERYEATDLLGHAALGGGVLATYEIDGRRGEFFFSELANEAAAQEALEAFRREKERWAEVADAPAGFRFQDPGAGSGTVLRAGRFVAGVHGELPFEAQEELLKRFTEGLGG